MTGCLAGSLCSLALLAGEQPNIVFIMSDDHAAGAISSYGGRLASVARTPNIDRLASQGALLRNCFCTNSICVPSRASILTGQYSHRNGVRHLSDALSPRTDNVANRLQQAGYQTALVGKWHLKREPAGFDYWNIVRGQGRYHDPVMFERDLEEPRVEEGSYSSDLFTSKALAWLERRDRSRPFCLMLHFKATHAPWNFHPRHAELYRDVSIPEPDSLLGVTGPAGGRVPGWPLEILAGRMRSGALHGDGRFVPTSEDPRILRREVYQKFLKDYLRCVAAIDENVGRVMSYLEAQGLESDTVLVYTSDQGYFLGEHNYFDKRFMLEESLRMPFIVRHPAEIAPGTLVEEMVLNVDFPSYFLDLAGAPDPGSMQGRSFRPLFSGKEVADWRQSMYYRYFSNSRERPSHYGIRTASEKLIYYDGLSGVEDEKRWEYYDLAGDPGENTNAYAGENPRVRALKRRLAELRTQLGDSD